MLKDRKRKYNQVSVKLFSDGGKHQKIKVVQMSTLRTAGIEEESCILPDVAEPNRIPYVVSEFENHFFDRCKEYDIFAENVLTSDCSDEEKERMLAGMYQQLFAQSDLSDFPDYVPPTEGDVKREKMRESIARARSRIYELAFCNQWDLFFTGTLDAKKQNRSDLEQFRKDLSQFIRDVRKKYGCKINYLFVPELHKDRENWHMHGLISGLPSAALKKFEIGDNMGFYIAKKVLEGSEVFSWTDYHKRFGFCDLEPVKSHEAVAAYISKYISKSLDRGVSDLGKHLYYCSQGLNRSKEIAKGTPDSAELQKCLGAPSFEGEYCNVWWLDSTPELLAQLGGTLILSPAPQNGKINFI